MFGKNFFGLRLLLLSIGCNTVEAEANQFFLLFLRSTAFPAAIKSSQCNMKACLHMPGGQLMLINELLNWECQLVLCHQFVMKTANPDIDLRPHSKIIKTRTNISCYSASRKKFHYDVPRTGQKVFYLGQCI